MKWNFVFSGLFFGMFFSWLGFFQFCIFYKGGLIFKIPTCVTMIIGAWFIVYSVLIAMDKA